MELSREGLVDKILSKSKQSNLLLILAVCETEELQTL